MRALLVLVLLSCGPTPDEPRAGEPCPGWGKATCIGGAVYHCADAGVWEFAHDGCSGLGVSVGR